MLVTLICEYQNTYNDYEYFKYAKDLSNGILSMQRLEGRFNHVLNDNFIYKEKDRIIYYEGEAVLALCKIYELTKEEKYLDSARKAVDYYLLSNYEINADHWQEYAINEFVNFDNSEDYIYYGLKNALNALEKIKEDKAYNTSLEILNNALNLFKDLSLSGENNLELEEIKSSYNSEKDQILATFSDILALDNNIDNKALIEKFFSKNGYKSVRIDDVAHYILALLD